MKGSEWVRSSGKEMSPFGERVADFLNDVFSGIYHISNEVYKTDFSGERNISMTIYDGGSGSTFATYDSDYLTRLVLLAHKQNIRISIQASTHRYLKINFMVVDRFGFFADQHPTLEEALDRIGNSILNRKPAAGATSSSAPTR